ncbi:hypothetical protein QJS66_00555 [Kocuria rhizophila]|nr:hypothetical protein QJS66_00555 [Kocuria rhizophila]
MLERLENKGLVTRRQDSQDLRGVRVGTRGGGGAALRRVSADDDQEGRGCGQHGAGRQEIRVLTPQRSAFPASSRCPCPATETGRRPAENPRDRDRASPRARWRSIR